MFPLSIVMNFLNPHTTYESETYLIMNVEHISSFNGQLLWGSWDVCEVGSDVCSIGQGILFQHGRHI